MTWKMCAISSGDLLPTSPKHGMLPFEGKAATGYPDGRPLFSLCCLRCRLRLFAVPSYFTMIPVRTRYEEYWLFPAALIIIL